LTSNRTIKLTKIRILAQLLLIKNKHSQPNIEEGVEDLLVEILQLGAKTKAILVEECKKLLLRAIYEIIHRLERWVTLYDAAVEEQHRENSLK